MTAQLPAHLQNRQVRSLTERASEGMGSTLPPHVSLAGNSFTFIDAAGNEMRPMLTFDAVIIDVSDRMNKRYYDKPYNPKEQGEAPRCWSANGITPSREVAVPVAPACDGCHLNVRGSAISQISQAAIKACRDEKWIAFIVPQLPAVVFQLVVTPGSFKNWKAYTETMRGMGVELSLAITRFSFVPGSTGELLFENVGWIDEATVGVVEASVREGKTDAIVGRSDPVRQPALTAPAQHQTLPPPNNLAPAQEVIPPTQPTQFGQFAQAAPQAPFVQTATPVAPTATGAGFATQPATSAAEAPRRRRRSANEAAPAPVSGFGQPAAAAPQAPFGQPAQAASSGPGFGQPAAGQFGIGGAAPVNADMAAMLAQMGMTQRAPA